MDITDNALNRLRYHWPDGTSDNGGDCEKTYWIRQTLDGKGLGDTSTIRFTVPTDHNAFTNANCMYTRFELQVLRSDGSPLTATDRVFLGPGALQSLFRSCQVYLNKSPTEPLNQYSYSATLASYLSLSNVARNDIWTKLAGMHLPEFGSSKLLPTDYPDFVRLIQQTAGSRIFSLTGRLQSDFCCSLTQLLPPGMEMEILLTRTPDSFTLCSVSEDLSQTYKLVIHSASLFTKRVVMNKATMDRCRASISNGGLLRYNRLGCLVSQINESTLNHRWNDIYNGGKLPYCLYVVFVSQKAHNGDFFSLPNYFESANIKSLRLFENGRPIRPEPYTTAFKYLKDGYTIDIMDSDATQPFLGVCDVINSLSDSTITTGLSYSSFLQGCLIWPTELNSCGGRMAPQGTIDLEIEFTDGPRPPLHVIVMSEYDKVLRFDGNLNLVTT